MRHRFLLPILALLALAVTPAPSPVSEQAGTLRNLGLGQLENEQPAQSAETFRKLAQAMPNDPLPYANLAVAALRVQNSEEAVSWINQALAKAPGRADLLMIQGDILQWSGKDEEALAAYRKSAAAAPDSVFAWYAVYRQAGQGSSPEAEAALGEALAALTRLRPENLVVLFQAGQRAIAAGDRAGATKAFLRIRELIEPAPPQAAAGLGPLMTALESGEVATARVPAIRLENVLKPSPASQGSLKELSPGILGVPVERFASEPPPALFGDPLPVKLQAGVLAEGKLQGRALAVGDFDGDDKPDLAWIKAGEAPKLEVRRAAGEPAPGLDAAGIEGLLAADLDNDGRLDLIGHGPKRVAFWRGQGNGAFEDATAAAGLSAAAGNAAAVLDYDIEGDLDLAVAGEGAGLFRNALQGPLEAVGKQVLPGVTLSGIRDLVASDLDQDGDVDLAVAHAGGVAWLDNLRQGRFADRTAASGLGGNSPVESLASADLDNDGLPDLIAAGQGLTLWHNTGGRFTAWTLTGIPKTRFTGVLAFDADNDGRLDLAAAGPEGVTVLGQRGTSAQPVFEPLAVAGAGPSAALVSADLDADGDLDLVAAGEGGLHRLENQGGNKNHWLSVRLKALAQGSGK
ncbi:MAG TPA: FG-GAP-like repeat-containing protein, partial [Thermoanaerobaculia bacterium]|nr:FG-GAP-like repeat-containing protein [Thermoanaerobaculia bacterium]